MIEWLRAKTNPVPTQYPILMLLSNGDILIGVANNSFPVVAWSIVNRPNWLDRKFTGKASGERHYKVRISDADCEMIRELYSSGGITYAQIAEKYECSKSTVRDIVKCRTRFIDRCG